MNQKKALFGKPPHYRNPHKIPNGLFAARQINLVSKRCRHLDRNSHSLTCLLVIHQTGVSHCSTAHTKFLDRISLQRWPGMVLFGVMSKTRNADMDNQSLQDLEIEACSGKGIRDAITRPAEPGCTVPVSHGEKDNPVIGCCAGIRGVRNPQRAEDHPFHLNPKGPTGMETGGQFRMGNLSMDTVGCDGSKGLQASPAVFRTNSFSAD
jgi:hypothetical protein